MKASKCLAVGRKEAMTCDICGKCIWIWYDIILPPFFWSFSYHSIFYDVVFFFPFGELGLKLGGQVKPQSCSQLPPRWCLVSLETAPRKSYRNHVENETPQIGGALLDENQLSVCIHDATPQAAETLKMLEEVWHQTSSKNWTYTFSKWTCYKSAFPKLKVS